MKNKNRNRAAGQTVTMRRQRGGPRSVQYNAQNGSATINSSYPGSYPGSTLPPEYGPNYEYTIQKGPSGIEFGGNYPGNRNSKV